jgi:hypothetical protein
VSRSIVHVACKEEEEEEEEYVGGMGRDVYQDRESRGGGG